MAKSDSASLPARVKRVDTLALVRTGYWNSAGEYHSQNLFIYAIEKLSVLAAKSSSRESGKSMSLFERSLSCQTRRTADARFGRGWGSCYGQGHSTGGADMLERRRPTICGRIETAGLTALDPGVRSGSSCQSVYLVR